MPFNPRLPQETTSYHIWVFTAIPRGFLRSSLPLACWTVGKPRTTYVCKIWDSDRKLGRKEILLNETLFLEKWQTQEHYGQKTPISKSKFSYLIYYNKYYIHRKPSSFNSGISASVDILCQDSINKKYSFGRMFYKQNCAFLLHEETILLDNI